jgi:nicotinamide-nucleotide amidase
MNDRQRRRAAVITVGDEVVNGLIRDTNAEWLCERLRLLGFSIVGRASALDYEDDIRDAIDFFSPASDLIVVTGGLGPTEDDRSMSAVAGIVPTALMVDDDALEKVRARYAAFGREMPLSGQKQATIPFGSVPLFNEVGTATGCFIRYAHTFVTVLPGPPGEMKPMFENYAVKEIVDRFGETPALETVQINCFGAGESVIGEKILDLMKAENGPVVRICVTDMIVKIRVSAKRPGEPLRDIVEEIERRMGHLVFSRGDISLAYRVFELLRNRDETLVVAESCTGGMLSSSLVDIPGSSSVLLAGYVTYSNEAKTDLLNVPAEFLESGGPGAVSEETAAAMAEGAKNRSGADWALSITGIAGPEGGTKEKPVGLVWFGLVGPHGMKTRKVLQPGDRNTIRQRSSLTALNLLRLELESHS